MKEVYHIPAMLKETIEGLNIKSEGIYVDVTFGGGGHSRAILAKLRELENGDCVLENGDCVLENGDCTLDKGHLYSFDQDGDAIENERARAEKSESAETGERRVETGEREEKGEKAETGERVEKSERGEKSESAETGERGEKGERVERGEKAEKSESVETGESAETGERSERGDEGEDCALYGNEQWTFVHSNFRYLKNWMDYYGVEQIDGLLADLGVSFHHFDCPERGFSFRFSAPLDMRMNQTAKRTAADIVNGYSEEELAKILYLYGELKNGRGIAKNICQARSKSPILRTEELVAAALNIPISKLEKPENPEISEKQENPRELNTPVSAKKDLARLFQALRIEVNDEMGALREMLVAARALLKPGGRIAVLTYHSLEDRLVKNFLRSGNLEGTIEKDFYGNNLSPFTLIEKGREASEEEVERNPRSRSAKLRVAEKR